MQKTGTHSWQILWNLPETLQFCSHVGQRESFQGLDDRSEPSLVEAQWRQWRRLLLDKMLDAFTAELTLMNSNVPPDERVRQMTAWFFAAYDPPAFLTLADFPPLQDLCRTYWPAFSRQWHTVGGEGWVMENKLRAQTRRLPMNQIVHDCAQASGKRVIAPFVLRMDFVCWPEDYQQHLSEQYVVLGRNTSSRRKWRPSRAC